MVDYDKHCSTHHLEVHIKTNARNQNIEVVEDILYVEVKARPIQGKANKELIKLLATELKLHKNQIAIVSGHTSRKKIIELSNIDIDQICLSLSKFQQVQKKQ